MENNTPILEEPHVPIHVLRKALKKLNHLDDNALLSFTYILTLCFPSVINNIQTWGQDCYTAGYIDGLKNKDNDS